MVSGRLVTDLRNFPPPPPMAYTIGVDFGQAVDFTAVAVIEADRRQGPYERVYALRRLERAPLGTSYPAIVAGIESLMREPGLADAALICDYTGVGRPVLDLLRAAGLRPKGVTITAGHTVTRAGDDYTVPKLALISGLQVVLQSGRLKIAAGLPLAATLTRELLAFRMEIRLAGEAPGAAREQSPLLWRAAEHDDLVLATALACWWAARGGGAAAAF